LLLLFFFIFSFKNFITLLLCAMASALLLIIFIDYIIFVVVGGEVFVSVRSNNWFKNDVHNENHVKNHVCTMGSSMVLFVLSSIILAFSFFLQKVLT
jgi:hypothetical protein